MKGLFARDFLHDSNYTVVNQLINVKDAVLGQINVLGYQTTSLNLSSILKFAYFNFVTYYDSHYYYNNCTTVYSSSRNISLANLQFRDYLIVDGYLDATFNFSNNSGSAISNFNGIFNGTVFAKSDLGLYNGLFIINNVTLDFQMDNSTSIVANEFQNSPIHLDSVNRIQSPLATLIPLIGTLSGSIVFAGTSQYITNLCNMSSDSPAVLLSPDMLVVFFVILILFTVLLNILICRIRTVDDDLDILRPRNFVHPDTIADNFLTAYMTDLESTAQAVKAYTRIPPAMEKSQFKHTMLMPRIFPDFPFQKEPIVDISEMYRVGRQIISFSTVQECSIQCSSVLKPRVYKNESPQPPPSFESTSNLLSAYFEVTLVKREPGARIGFGFATCPYPTFRLPGHDSLSIAYHSSLGRVYLNSREGGKACGFPMKEGDTAGIGYRIITPPGESVLPHLVFYFTYNGVRIGDEFSVYGFNPYKLYPTIGAEGVCTVEVYFGDLNSMFLD